MTILRKLKLMEKPLPPPDLSQENLEDLLRDFVLQPANERTLNNIRARLNEWTTVSRELGYPLIDQTTGNPVIEWVVHSHLSNINVFPVSKGNEFTLPSKH